MKPRRPQEREIQLKTLQEFRIQTTSLEERRIQPRLRLNAPFYKPNPMFNCITVFLAESAPTLEFTNPMFNCNAVFLAESA